MKLIEESKQVKFYTTNRDEIDEYINKIKRQGEWKITKSATKSATYCENSKEKYNVIIDMERQYYD